MRKLSWQIKISAHSSVNTWVMRRSFLLLALLSLACSAEEQTGDKVYATTCIECHGTGKHGAPVFADRKRWKRLIGEGLDDLVPAALRGVRQMPAKGGNPALSDREVAQAVIYMANAGGGKFVDPTSADIDRWRHKANRRKNK